MFINNSTNIKKANIHISSWFGEEKKKTTTLEIQVLVWDRLKHVAGINWLIGSQSSPLDNWITISYAYTNVKNLAQIRIHSQRPHTNYYHKNE